MVPSSAHRLLAPIVVLIWALFALHASALYYHLYGVFPWLDSVMHVLGGFWVGLAGLWFFGFSGYAPRVLRVVHPVVVALLTGLCFAMLWEYFELLVQSASGVRFEGNWEIDTATDLLCGAGGMLTGVLWGRHKTKSAAGEAPAATITETK